MNEFNVELFIDTGDKKSTKLSVLKEKELKKWKENMEIRALSEYYKQRVKIKKI